MIKVLIADDQALKFQDEDFDFAGLLKLWDWYEKTRKTRSNNQTRKACRQNFLSANRIKK